MSLAELFPDVQALTRDDKLRLMQALATDLARAEGVLPIPLLTENDEGDPDLDLTAAERAGRDVGIARGDEDFAAGRYRSFEAVKADKRTRFELDI